MSPRPHTTRIVPAELTARRWGTLAGVVLVAATAAGCDAQVGTSVEVTGADTATVVVSATFDGEAAQVLAEDAATRKGLIDVFTNRAGTKPQLQIDPKRVHAQAEVSYARLADLSGITGVTGVTLSSDGHTATVQLAPATELAKVVAEKTRDQEDATVLAQTILDTTTLSISVRYPGGISKSSSTVDGARLRRAGNTVTLTRDASSQATGSLSVTGDPSGGVPWVPLGAAGVGLAGAGVALSRRRRDPRGPGRR